MTLLKKQNKSPTDLPDSIVKLAVKKNIRWIEQRSFTNESIYRFQSPQDNVNSSKITFNGNYYTGDGKVIIPNNHFLSEQSWWRYYNGRFYNTRFRPGYR